MKYSHVFLIVAFVFCAVSCVGCDETVHHASLVYTRVAPAKGDKQWPIHEDKAVKMIAVGYGDATRKSNPGFFVFRKGTGDWIRIDKISTRGAILGRSPTFEEVKKAGKTIPSIGWDFQSLAEETYVDFPLSSAGFLFFPDRVERDDKKKEYVLGFNTGWEIKGVETILRLPIDAFITNDLEQSRAGNGLRTAPEE